MILVDFGKRLKELRTQAGMTQSQLSKYIGVTKSVISFYELQERASSPEVLIKLARVFHVSTDYLLGLDKRETLDITGISEKDIALLRALAESLRNKNV
ncbi:MAG: helix-turn-helix transcriptional regulator [Oscillospiraceae bacterium]|nr:helix-turn-helix transcriptional regulator [Oscillospiraceae bacterium]MBR1845188.1 helix-turn-helix transcriptional regulator [Oscillospiraceae bacterium]